jgi:O-antigen ligase
VSSRPLATPRPGDQLPQGRRRLKPAQAPSSGAVFFAITLWILMVYEFDIYLYARSGLPFYRIPLLIAPVLALMILGQSGKKATYWPLNLFILLHFGAAIFAANVGFARGPLKFMIYVLILFAGSVKFLDSPQRMKLILKLYLLSFVWFGLQGLQTGGKVTWHSLLSNEDSYGPLMVIVMPIGFFFALATSSATWRWIARGAFALGLLGVIVSFARGAALAAAVTLLYILLRTPNKAKSFTFLMIASIVMLPLAATLVPFDAYTAEIATSTQGDDARSAIWKLAWIVFKSSPIIGVGAGNFGVVGVDLATPDIVKQMGAGLYMMAVHNTLLQILAEEGLIGVGLFLAMLFSLVRWNRALRTPQAQAVWAQRGAEGLDLRLISLGLEGATVGFVGTSIFYNQIYIHWFWTILIITYVLFRIANPGETRSPSRAAPRLRSTRPLR